MNFTLEFITLNFEALGKTFWVNGEPMIYLGTFSNVPMFVKTTDGSRHYIKRDDFKSTFISTEAPQV